MTISPSDVSRVAVYRFDVSMPIAGADLKSCCLGADPSNGGNSEAMAGTLTPSAQSGTDSVGGMLSHLLASAVRAVLLPAAARRLAIGPRVPLIYGLVVPPPVSGKPRTSRYSGL